MAPLPATPTGVLAVIYRHTVGSDQNVTSKLHFRYTGGPPSTAQMTALAADIKTAWAAQLAPWLFQGENLNAVTVLDLANPAVPPGVWAGTQAGTRASSALPASIAVVSSYHIARRYRGGHPRGYWPYMAQADQTTPGAFLSASVAGFLTALQAHIAAVKALASGGVAIGNQCSVSYYSGGHWVAGTGTKPKWIATLRTPPAIDDVTVVTVNTRPGSQRRRMKKA